MRYHPHTEADRKEMLAAMGMKSMQDLFADIPEKVRLTRELNIPGGPLSEQELVKHLGELSGKNANLAEYVSFLGGGVYDHYIPSAVNHLLLRSEFFTAYTPYQPEISQGTLTAIFEYQTLICRLTGMEVANASMYDGASALAEAVLMAAEAVRRKEILLSAAVHPEYREVVKTYARGQGLAVAEVPFTGGITDLDALKAKISGNTAAVVVQNPNFFGCIEPVLELGEAAHSQGGLYIVAVEPVSLGILKPPGEYGADIVVGDGQSLGTPPSYGGPHLGFMAATAKLVRRMPGRIVGQTVDTRGVRAFVLTLQAREQHIRREKATSNICSNQALNALAATIYLCLLGKKGIRELAELCLQKAHYLAGKLAGLPGFRLAFSAPFFQEFVVRTPAGPALINQALLKDKILGGLDLGTFYPELAGHQMFAVTERRTRAEMDALAARLDGIVARRQNEALTEWQNGEEAKLKDVQAQPGGGQG